MKITKRKIEEELSPEDQALLEQRAELLRARRQDTSGAAEQAEWVAEFPIADEFYGFPLLRVRAVIPLRLIAPVPLAPPHVLGVVRFEGDMITAISLVALLGVRGWRSDSDMLIVLERSHGGLIAVDSESAPRATTLPHAVIEEARAVSSGPILDVRTRDMRVLRYIHDIEALIPDAKVDALAD